MTAVVLGLGSNKSLDGISCPEVLDLALDQISVFLKNMKTSSLYRSAAMYVTDQDDFYNMVVSGFYDGTPQSLLEDIHRVEASLGRDRSKEYRNGPRTLDVDIELFGNQCVNTKDLIIPHERMTERAFVLKPLLELFEKNADDYKEVFPHNSDYYSRALSFTGNQEVELLDLQGRHYGSDRGN